MAVPHVEHVSKHHGAAGEARRARAAASDGAAKLPPPSSLASECSSTSRSYSTSREAERGGGCEGVTLLNATVPSQALTNIRCRLLLSPQRLGVVGSEGGGQEGAPAVADAIRGVCGVRPLLDEGLDAAE